MSHNTKKTKVQLLLIIGQYVGKNIMKFRPKIDDLFGIGNAVSDSGFMLSRRGMEAQRKYAVR